MRASPAFQVSVHRFGVWRAGVGVLAVSGATTLAAWLIAHEPPIGIAGVAAAAGSAATFLWLAAALAGSPAFSLRWDGRLWRLGRPETLPDEALPGELVVAIDLGPWMLLRFMPSAATGRRARATWLPVQRRGIESQWHALRCSVYSPRPTPATDAEP